MPGFCTALIITRPVQPQMTKECRRGSYTDQYPKAPRCFAHLHDPDMGRGLREISLAQLPSFCRLKAEPGSQLFRCIYTK